MADEQGAKKEEKGILEQTVEKYQKAQAKLDSNTLESELGAAYRDFARTVDETGKKGLRELTPDEIDLFSEKAFQIGVEHSLRNIYNISKESYQGIVGILKKEKELAKDTYGRLLGFTKEGIAELAKKLKGVGPRISGMLTNSLLGAKRKQGEFEIVNEMLQKYNNIDGIKTLQKEAEKLDPSAKETYNPKDLVEIITSGAKEIVKQQYQIA